MSRHRTCRTVIASAAAAVLAGSVPAAIEAQEIAGTWVLSVDLSAGSGDATFVLEQRGDSIFGTYSGVLGEQQVKGTLEGNRVRFSFSEGQVGTVSYDGTVEGNTMSGRCSYGMLGDGTFSGTKREPGTSGERRGPGLHPAAGRPPLDYRASVAR